MDSARHHPASEANVACKRANSATVRCARAPHFAQKLNIQCSIIIPRVTRTSALSCANNQAFLPILAVTHTALALSKKNARRPFYPLYDGALAQLVERFHGMEEVNGSTPLSSTNPL